MPVPAPLPAPPLRAWSRIWRYLLVVSIGAFLWIVTLADYLGFEPNELSGAESAVLAALMILDLLLGAIAVGVLPLRRRLPVLTAVLTSVFSAVSVFSIGASTLAIVSLSTRRRWKPVVSVGIVWILGTIFYEFVLRPSVPGATVEQFSSWASGGVAAGVYAILATTGFYIGARRDLIASLRERADNAEREQVLREGSARESERTRIAREMHDVLAHHISLVSLHAGALTYRTDLSREETAEAATIIQNNAQLALTELRQILGVLRSNGGGDGAEPPQPTLADLDGLLAGSRESGTDVTRDGGPLALDDLSPAVSRTAYRIVQEALTNARKHAFGAPVTVELERRDDELRVVVRNPLRDVSRPDPSSPAAGARSSGMGLLGLRERAELAGGSLAHGVDRADRFVVTAKLPWRRHDE